MAEFRDKKPSKIRPSSTALLCQLAQLKSQQNFLEKIQTNLSLNIEEFDDPAEKNMVNEIETQRKVNKTDFQAYRVKAKDDTKMIFENVSNLERKMGQNEIKSMNVIAYREHVIEIDGAITKCSKEIKTELEILKGNYKMLELQTPQYWDILKDPPKKLHAIKNNSSTVPRSDKKSGNTM